MFFACFLTLLCLLCFLLFLCLLCFLLFYLACPIFLVFTFVSTFSIISLFILSVIRKCYTEVLYGSVIRKCYTEVLCGVLYGSNIRSVIRE